MIASVGCSWLLLALLLCPGERVDLAGTFMYYGYSSNIRDIYLPMGNQDNDNVTLALTVINSNDVSSKNVFNVQVLPPKNKSDIITSLSLDIFTKLEQMLYSADTQKVTQLVRAVSSLLYAQHQDLEQQHLAQQRAELRTSLLNALSHITSSVCSIKTITQVTAALADVTEIPEELTSDVNTSAAKSALYLSDMLMQQLDPYSSDMDVTSSLLMKIVSNILASVLQPKDLVQAMDDPNNFTLHNNMQRTLTLASLSALKNIKARLSHEIVQYEVPIVLHSDLLVLQLSKSTPSDLQGAQISVQTPPSVLPASITLPPDISVSGQEISIEVTQFYRNPFTWSATPVELNTDVIQLELRNQENLISISNLTQPISIFLPISAIAIKSSSVIISQYSKQYIEANILRKDGTLLLMFSGDVLEGRVNPFSQIFLKLMYVAEETTDTNTSSDNVVYIERHFLSEHIQPGHSMVVATVVLQIPIPVSELQVNTSSPWRYKIATDTLPGMGTYLIELAVDDPALVVNVSVLAALADCRYWDEVIEEWKNHGCVIGQLVNLTHLHCECNHMTAFSGYFDSVISIDILGFSINLIGVITLGIALVLKLITLICARRKDRANRFKSRPIDLMDNDTCAKHIYLLTVYTGCRKHSGTSSIITVILHGIHGDSEPHVLECCQFHVLKKGHIDFFLIRTAHSLGEIQCLHIWLSRNDSTYSDKELSWYLSNITVEDVSQHSQYNVPCHSWLTVNNPDQTFNVSGTSRSFTSHLKSAIRDRHIWLCILRHPSPSAFTSVRRVCCCFCIFTMFMMSAVILCGIRPDPTRAVVGEIISSYIYGTLDLRIFSMILYDGLGQFLPDQSLQLGSFTISIADLYTGMAVAMLLLPIQFLILCTFRTTNVCCKPIRNNLDMALGVRDPDRLPNKYFLSDAEDKILELASKYSSRKVTTFPKVVYSSMHTASKDEPAEDTDVVHLPEITASMERLLDHPRLDVRTRLTELLKEPDLPDDEEFLYAHKGQHWRSITEMFNVDVSKFGEFERTLPEKHILFKLQMLKHYRHFIMNRLSESMGNDDKLKELEVELLQKYNPVLPEDDKNSEHQKNTDYIGIDMECFGKLDEDEDLSDSSQQSSRKLHSPSTTLVTNSSTGSVETVLTEDMSAHNKKQTKKIYCVPLGWMMLSVITLACILFSCIYTINYSMDRSIKWLKALTIALLWDVLIGQWIQIFVFALLSRLFSRGPQKWHHIDMKALPSKTQSDELYEITNLSLQWLRENAVYQPPHSEPVVDDLNSI